MRNINTLIILCFILVLGACRTNDNAPVIETARLPQPDSRNFSPQIEVISAQDIFSLNLKQQQQFLSYYHASKNQNIAPHRRLFNYLDRRLGNFTFRGETLIAEQVLSQNKGNCLSLAILTTALAKLVDLEVEYQLVNSLPIYRMEDKLLLLSVHVRTFIYDPTFQPADGIMVFRRPRIVIDYFPSSDSFNGEEVTEADFIAMYYRNQASNAMVKQDYNKAFWLLRTALELSELSPESINMLAVLYRKTNQQPVAEQFYKFGIEKTKNSVNLMANYSIFLNSQGRSKEAAMIDSQLGNFDSTNPYQWLNKAHRAFRQEQWSKAARYYNKVIEIAPYLDIGYFGLAKTYYEKKNYKKAALTMEKAIENAYKPEARRLYFAKLATLKSTTPTSK